MRLPEMILTGVALVQISLVAVVGLLAWLAARRGGPALRGAVLLATLAGLLTVPVLAAVAPVWLPLPDCVCPAVSSAGGVPASPPPPSMSPAVFSVVIIPPPAKVPPDAKPAQPPAGEILLLPPAKAELVVLKLTGALENQPPPSLSVEAPSSPPWSAAAVLAVVWLLGALACLSHSLLRLALLYRCAHRARPVRLRLGSIALRESPDVTSPLALGLFRPVILLPTGWRGWSAQQRALVLRHEAAHVRRLDFLAGLVAEVAVDLCWFHPLVRWLAGRLRLEQEFAADAWAATNDATDYVRCLARLALAQGGGRGSLAPAFWRRRPEILRRIDMLRRNPHGQIPRLGRRSAWTVAAVTAAACLAIAGVGPLRSAADEPQSAASGRDTARQATADAHGDPLPAGVLARLGTTRLRHGADVTFVAFGPGGKTLITAGQDGTVRLWDMASGQEIRRFNRPNPATPPAKQPKAGNRLEAMDLAMMQMGGGRPGGGDTFGVAVSPDGKTLAAAGGGLVQLWDVETGKTLHRIQVATGRLTGLLFAPNGRVLAGRAADNTLFLWATDTGAPLHQLKPVPRPAATQFVVAALGRGNTDAPGLAFTPDGKALAAVLTDFEKEAAVQSIKFWDVATGKVTGRIKTPDGVTVTAVAVTPDGKRLAYVGGGFVHLCEAESGKELHKLPANDGGLLALAFSPDGATLAARGRNQRVRLWSTATGKEVRQLGEAQTDLPVGFDGAIAFVSGFNPSAPERRVLAFSADGTRVAAAAGNTFRVWDAATGKELPLLGGHRRAPSHIVHSADGKTLISWGPDRMVRRWEAATGKPLGAFPAPAGTTTAAFTADGRLVALANADNTIRLQDTATAKQRHKLSGTGGVADLAFSPDGKVLATRGSNNSVRLYDVARGAELRPVRLQPGDAPANQQVIVFGGPVRAAGPGLAFAPDGKVLVVPGAGNNALTVIDVASGKELRKITPSQPINSLAFSPDGRTLATENTDRTVTLWEVASGKERGRLGTPTGGPARPTPGMAAFTVTVDGAYLDAGDASGPVGLTFSPDGRALAVRGPQQAVCLWDVSAGKEIGRLKGHGGGVAAVAFAPDGQTLAAGAGDTTILRWDAAGALKGLATPRPVELSAAQVEALWGDLADANAGKALRGVHGLAGAPGPAVPFLSSRLQPAVRIDPKKIAGWLADLESSKYAVRMEAADNLLKTGEQSLPSLRKVLASAPALETRKRAEELVDRLTSGTLTVEQLRLVRAVEALERMANPEARRLLRTLAEGAPGALPTREAQAALDRLAARRP